MLLEVAIVRQTCDRPGSVCMLIACQLAQMSVNATAEAHASYASLNAAKGSRHIVMPQFQVLW
jgi:hypothetical protein